MPDGPEPMMPGNCKPSSTKMMPFKQKLTTSHVMPVCIRALK